MFLDALSRICILVIVIVRVSVLSNRRDWCEQLQLALQENMEDNMGNREENK